MDRNAAGKALNNGTQYTIGLTNVKCRLSGVESMQDRIDILTCALYQAQAKIENDPIVDEVDVIQNIEHALDEIEMMFADRNM